MTNARPRTHHGDRAATPGRFRASSCSRWTATAGIGWGGGGVGAERGFAAGVGRGTRTRLCAEGYGRLAGAGDVPGLPGWGGACRFIGLTAEPYHTHAIWYGMMNALGIFRMNRLVQEDLEIYTEQMHGVPLQMYGAATTECMTFGSCR